jgi:hypothetical protein
VLDVAVIGAEIDDGVLGLDLCGAPSATAPLQVYGVSMDYSASTA